MPHVMPKLAFFQVQIEIFGSQSAAGGQADFGDTPNSLHARRARIVVIRNSKQWIYLTWTVTRGTVLPLKIR